MIARHVEPPRARADSLPAFASIRPARRKRSISTCKCSRRATPFRFIHVMGGDEQRHALPGEFEKQIPQFAARDRIDARRRFVEKKNRRLVHERASHGQPLPPAAGKQRRAPVRLGSRCVMRDQFVAPLFQLRARADHKVCRRKCKFSFTVSSS